jgi:hypothetical protein
MAEIEKYFHSIFGSNENLKICFRDYLTFTKDITHYDKYCEYHPKIHSGAKWLTIKLLLVIMGMKQKKNLKWPTQRK